MPIYEYKCPVCKCEFEVYYYRMDKIPKEYCGKCNVIMKRVISVASLHFKGSGFYVNDYK